MGCRGVFFALTETQEADLRATRDDAEVRAFVRKVEGGWDRDWLCETDKAWDAMHRCLADGTLRCGPRSSEPLALTVLGGGHHYEGEDYIVAHVLADEVPLVAAALEAINEAWLRERYNRIDPDDYQGEMSDEDFDYTWYYLREAREFYRRAADAGRSVIFTVDQ